MSLYRGAVDENLRGRPAGLRQSVKEIDPDAFLGPADVAVVERFLRPVFRWRVDPSTDGFKHMDDAADHPAVVEARLAAHLSRQMRLDLGELRVRQPELFEHRRRLLSEAVNHKLLLTPTTL